jgi:hypothetical protein
MLYNKILRLKQETLSITTNPVLSTFNLDECKYLDDLYATDTFVKQKIDNCLAYLRGLAIDFSPGYRSAYEEFTEAIVYADLSKKCQVTRVPEAATQTPDFNLVGNGENPFNIYAEVKALSFLDGNLNYRDAQQSSLEAHISIEEQAQAGHNIAFGETIVSPFHKNGKLPSTKELIEIYIDKINNNIKPGQYLLGDTILLIDIKQLLLGSKWDQSGIAFYQEGLLKSIASGLLWNTAFGHAGEMIYQPIEFEGKPNTDSPLEKNGILVDHNYIKGLVFATYENFEERKYIGFFRHDEQDNQPAIFISLFCDFHNDEKNTQAWKVLQNNGSYNE